MLIPSSTSPFLNATVKFPPTLTTVSLLLTPALKTSMWVNLLSAHTQTLQEKVGNPKKKAASLTLRWNQRRRSPPMRPSIRLNFARSLLRTTTAHMARSANSLTESKNWTKSSSLTREDTNQRSVTLSTLTWLAHTDPDASSLMSKEPSRSSKLTVSMRNSYFAQKSFHPSPPKRDFLALTTLSTAKLNKRKAF